MTELIVSVIFLVILVWLVVSLFEIVGRMATARGHNPWFWWLLSLVWSPLATIVLLWLFFAPTEADGDEFPDNEA